MRDGGSLIESTNGHSSGIVPWIKTLDASVAAVNQGGKRKGACCVYLEPWLADIEEFLELRNNTGDEAARTRNLNLVNWIPDPLRCLSRGLFFFGATTRSPVCKRAKLLQEVERGGRTVDERCCLSTALGMTESVRRPQTYIVTRRLNRCVRVENGEVELSQPVAVTLLRIGGSGALDVN